MRPEPAYDQIQPRFHYDHGIQVSEIPDAPKQIIRTLKSANYEAYLVGGCIRDLLLGLEPKDFDVVTSAKPEEIQELFPRSRIIGHRFRIVHVYDRRGHQVTEVSTFRSELTDDPSVDNRVLSKNGVLLRDNEYGTLAEDPYRRDFTINALYYDVDLNVILDFCGGLDDVASRTLQCIGSPQQKFVEDPARMLRAVRFIASRDLVPDTETNDAIREMKHRIRNVRPSRMNDEFHKLFLTGHAEKTYNIMREYDLMDELLVQSEASVSLTQQAMSSTDRRFHDNRPVIASFLFSVMLWHNYQREVIKASVTNGNNETRFLTASKIIGRLHQRISIPRRTAEFIRDTFELQIDLEQRKPNQVRDVLERKRFRAAFDLFELRGQSSETTKNTMKWWERVQEMNPAELNKAIRELSPQKRKRSNKRRRRSRNSNRARSSTVSSSPRN